MEFSETKPRNCSIYPHIYWGIDGKYGLANILLVLVERDPKIRANLYPLANDRGGKMTAQCKELAIILFNNIPEIYVHLGNQDGLLHYGISVVTRLQRWTEAFLDVIVTMPQSSNWPDREKIRLLCPLFARLAPLLWGFLKTRKRFQRHDRATAVQRTNLKFCSAVTVYNPQRAAAQVAAEDAILRQLSDPYRRKFDFVITAALPALKIGGKRERCASQKDQENLSNEGNLRKKHRRHGYHEELNPQIPEKVRHSNSKTEFPEAYPNLHCDKENTADNANTPPKYAIPPRIIHYPSQPTLPNLSYVSSSDLFVARLKEAASLEKQDSDCRPPPASLPHKGGHELSRNFPTTAPRRPDPTSGNNLHSTSLPRFFIKEENVDDEGKSWLELDQARLKKWSQIAENNRKHQQS